MNYYDRVQRGIDYIEDNITREISLEEIERQAYASLFHFKRKFLQVGKNTIFAA